MHVHIEKVEIWPDVTVDKQTSNKKRLSYPANGPWRAEMSEYTGSEILEGIGSPPHSGGRYLGFLIEWIFYWIESSKIKFLESIFELNFPGTLWLIFGQDFGAEVWSVVSVVSLAMFIPIIVIIESLIFRVVSLIVTAFRKLSAKSKLRVVPERAWRVIFALAGRPISPE